ncbi:MAG: aminomethyl-transferring glycine dehydrogenase [Proteobacteria bacterium]|nr:aminomethyl-transferring glycine dehydrogenase [Pseudomonadota bacterium]
MSFTQDNSRQFIDRHIGPSQSDLAPMLQTIGVKSKDDLIDKTVPASIRVKSKLNLPEAKTEVAATEELKAIAGQNKVYKSYIGTGYHGTVVPAVIQRNIFENPGWYTQYTPYQAEIAQGRLEAMLNFQTMICDLTELDVSNSSLLDEATAAAEAMMLAFSGKQDQASVFFISELCHPQVIEVVKTRAEPHGIEISVGSHLALKADPKLFGVLFQYPATDGGVFDYKPLISDLKSNGTFVVMACDVLALTLLESPGSLGADAAVGAAQRFGVPLGYGGPHAGFISAKDEHKRKLPGRIVGVSKDKEGRPAIRLALQTREQHIRREKATSNICTAQVLLAVMSSMYAVYHGPEGLKQIATRVNLLTKMLATGLESFGFKLKNKDFFDTVCVNVTESQKQKILVESNNHRINFRIDIANSICISLDETTTENDVRDILNCFTDKKCDVKALETFATSISKFDLPRNYQRKTEILKHSIFKKHRSESQLMRYIRGLEAKDLSLTTSMIPLGSCTMKLNAAAELYPVSWPEFANIHPFAPWAQSLGYQKMFTDLEAWLAEITGFAKISLQPNSGSQGEYAGLLVIRAYLRAKGDTHRNICLIPQSAHGTNPASAALAGMKIVVTACDKDGNIDVSDLKAKATEHAANLACLMVTYPSTHGVFEENIQEVCKIVHNFGGQVYMDGANMNAQVGLCRPGDIGADVCHLNLHKTFCIPHGGGGPGMGPIGVAKHLAEFLPGHPLNEVKTAKSTGPVSAAPWGSASILPISWMYIRMMGERGLTEATKVAIVNANYIAKKLDPHFPVLYKGKNGFVAHECIVDLRPLKTATGVEVEDVAKRLMDYGFHAPTVSFPVAGTLMIEPTESEDRAELDRFCDAMIAIRNEIKNIETGVWDRTINPLKMAPHTAQLATQSEWTLPYSREVAVFPAPWTRDRKFWPPVARVDSAYGDRNLVCTCPDLSEY